MIYRISALVFLSLKVFMAMYGSLSPDRIKIC